MQIEDAIRAVEAPRRSFSIAPLVWFGCLLALCYAPMILALFHQWQSDDDMGHGMFVPVLAGYIAWSRRDALAAIPPAPRFWGLLVAAFGGVQLLAASLAGELFLARTALLVSMMGIAIYLRGVRTVSALAFPLLLLLFMIPLPGIVYKQITFPLQILASRVAEATLDALGITVLRDGNILEFANQKLSIAEACSGIRSLLSLTFFSLIYGYFCECGRGMRVALFLAAAPIAIAANAGRIVLTGIVGRYSPELAESAFHAISGWVIFAIALGAFILTAQILDGAWSRFRHAA